MPRDRDPRVGLLRRVALLFLAVAGLVVLSAPALGYVYDERRQLPLDVATDSAQPAFDHALHPAEATERSTAPRYDDHRNPARADARLGGYRSAPHTALKLPTSQTWGRLGPLDDHFLRHGADFGARSADDYASQASQFFQRSQRQGLPTKIDANGVIRVYDPATNTFGAYNSNGTTATFFTPKTGADYWAKQPGVSPWSP